MTMRTDNDRKLVDDLFHKRIKINYICFALSCISVLASMWAIFLSMKTSPL
jgi:hypothetical protein